MGCYLAMILMNYCDLSSFIHLKLPWALADSDQATSVVGLRLLAGGSRVPSPPVPGQRRRPATTAASSPAGDSESTQTNQS
ncbi:hypothetical protein GUJ93_ZPchr0007g5215 [Zizania palustris]|uniref:Uncharacterized protein n=1 Tax=Zizania palustris TaxID=103762 RepID=A0A8J5SR47_ZIZPA|nr:hypothetical protein GUJ93_ZPchr0007g5215 [Zizania palustris]